MDSSEIWLNRGALVTFRGDTYEIGEFDSSVPGQNRVMLRFTPRARVDRWVRRPEIVEQQFFHEIQRV